LDQRQIDTDLYRSPRGRVRLLRDDDIPAAADIFQKVFRNRQAASTPLLRSHLTRIFLEHPHYDESCASLVFEGADGRIGGMLGALPLPMRFDDDKLSCAIISTWMVDDPARDRRAAVMLARAHLKRGHAITLSDTVNRTSVEFSMPLRFDFLAGASLQWVKPLNFAGYAASSAANGLGLKARPVVAAAHAAERVARAAAGRRGVQAFDGWRLLEVHPEVFAYGMAQVMRRYRLRPDWSIPDLTWMLALVAERKSCGELRLCEARNATGELVGVCIYFSNASGRAEVLQILTQAGAEEGVLRALIAHARKLGCAYVCGQADPGLIRGLFRIPRVFFKQTCATVLKSRSAEIVGVAAAGDAVIGGLVGDAWTPLASESYA